MRYYYLLAIAVNLLIFGIIFVALFYDPYYSNVNKIYAFIFLAVAGILSTVGAIALEDSWCGEEVEKKKKE